MFSSGIPNRLYSWSEIVLESIVTSELKREHLVISHASQMPRLDAMFYQKAISISKQCYKQ